MSENLTKIYQESINNPEKFWNDASRIFFGLKGPQKF